MKYAIHIAPVTENKSAVKRILREIIGPGQGNVINELINTGGVVARDLSNEYAEEIETRLRESGVVVEKKEMGAPDHPFNNVNLNDLFNFQVEHEKFTLTVQTPMGLRITLSEPDQSILLTDNHGNKIIMDAKGISMESGKDLSIKASGVLKVEATNVDIRSHANLKLVGGGGAGIDHLLVLQV